MKFREILKKDWVPPPGPPPPAGSPPAESVYAEPRDDEDAPAALFRFSRPAAEAPPPDEAPPAAPDAPPLKAEDPEVRKTYDGLLRLFERVALGQATPDLEDAQMVRRLMASVKDRDQRLVACAVRDTACGEPAKAALHRYVLTAFLARSLELPEEAYAALLVDSIDGPKDVAEAAPPSAQDDALGTFGRLAAHFHDLIHASDPAARLRPEEAAAAVVDSKGRAVPASGIRRFIDELSVFPPGTVVRLSNGKYGTVIQTNPGYPTRPMVALIDAQGTGTGVVDLRDQPLVRIMPFEDPKHGDAARHGTRRRRREAERWKLFDW